MESKFSDLDIDAMAGSEMMNLLGLTAIDLGDPQRFSKLQEVISFLKQFPEDTRKYLITKVVRGTDPDKLQKVLEYTNLLRKKTDLQLELEGAKKGLSILPADSDPILRLQYAQREVSAGDSIKAIDLDISRYEQ
jgi:hypothetical protein